ncbi:MAG: ACT domain-containing protein, partial [Bacteroidota bacterium]|nr:ACT domain-containing protein [Bacteroidota bacterium]
NPADTRKAIKAIKNEFEAEIDYKKEITILLEENLSIIAIVGEKMKNTPGISANLFTSLGRSGISVIATAQGSSELNISVVIKNIYLKKALNVIHDGFFLSKYKDLHLFLIGIGTVGKSLLRQIENQQEKLLHSHKLKINLVGISNSRKMLLNEGGIDLHNYLDRLNEEGVKANINEFVAKMAAMNIRNSVFIDCTANEDVAKLYNKVLDSYISIVAANKIACSSEYSLYKELKTKARDKNIKFIFETNVGAGLPIISTINDLIKSGDKIIKIEAVLSGTLNFVFNVLSADVPLSEAVRMAKEKGFSEPDPRIDLSGIDVVRKILILSREAGYEIEKKDVEIHTFLPKECFEGPVEDFWKKLPHYDEEFENKRKKLEASNKCWRFVAKLEDGKASVELMEVGQNHPAYHLEGSNNIILITTERYKEQPMIIKGYGAGAEVTAAGVFADIIRVANV